MTGALRNQIVGAAIAAADAHRQHPRIGIISSYDPVRYCAKARIQPDNTETGWLPVLTVWGGNGWGLAAGPTPGDVVSVQFQEGGREAGIVVGRFYSNVTRAPQISGGGPPSGEFWLVHQSGSRIRLLNSGKIEVHGTVEIDVGNVSSTLHALVTDAFQAIYNGHTHGSGPAPNQQMTSVHLTSILKAN